MRRILAFFLILSLIFVYFGCVETKPSEIKPNNIEIIGETEINIGESMKLEAKITPTNSIDKSINWESSNTDIAIVNNGIVTGIKEGIVSITASSNADSSVKDQIEITVKAKVHIHNYIDGKCECGAEEVMEHEHVFVNGECACGKLHDCIYVDEVCSCGKEEVKEHEHEFEDGKCECGYILPTYLKIVNRKYKHQISDYLDLDVIVYPENTTNKDVVWSVSNEKIATINKAGILMPVATGKVKVTVTSAVNTEVTSSITIEIVSTPEEADILVEELSITSDKEIYLLHDDLLDHLNIKINPIEADNKLVYWKLMNEDVVSIDKTNGEPYIKGIGTTTLTCYSVANPSINCSIEITVEDYVTPTALKLIDKNGIEKYSGKIDTMAITQIYIKTEPYNGDPRVSYVSNNPEIAIVEESGRIWPNGIGTTTITVTSIANPDLVLTYEITVIEHICPPEYITIDGEKSMYVGYKIEIFAKVYPENMKNDYYFEVHDRSKDLATIDENGVVTALKPGTFRVRAVCSYAPTKKSSYLSIDIKEVPEPYEIGDMKGYELVIMNSAMGLSDIDPFLDDYNDSDKLYKQRAWTEVEEKYNCDIQVVKYPDDAPWGMDRVNWIINNATNGTSQCDLGIVSTNWIYRFAHANAAIDVSEMYGKYGLSQIEPVLKTAGSYKGNLYVASTGISQTRTYVELGLFYNYGWLKELGVENPAKMFNEDKWFYSNFKQWVLDVQAKLGENEYVLGGAPYYYWYGMTNAAGQVIANTESSKVNILSSKSKEATSLICSLVEAGAVNTNITWSESNDIPNSFWRTDGGGTLMTTGNLSFVKNDNIWTDNMWGDCTTEFGYVPFPYPDDVAKEDTKIGVSGLSAYMYVAGRSYPAELGSNGFEKVWAIINEMFLNTIKYQEEDPLFNSEQIIEDSLKTQIDDPESIEAIRYYNTKRVFYDTAHAIYESVALSPLVTPVNNTIINGVDYEDEFNSVYEKYETDFLKIYSDS